MYPAHTSLDYDQGHPWIQRYSIKTEQFEKTRVFSPRSRREDQSGVRFASFLAGKES